MVQSQRIRRRRNDDCETCSSATIVHDASTTTRRNRSAYTGLMCWWLLCVVLRQTESFHVVSNFANKPLGSRSSFQSNVHHPQATSFRKSTSTTIRRRIQQGCASPPQRISSGGGNCRLHVASTSAAAGEDTVITRQKLQSLTVKELRQMVKESKYNERGILSKLKLKKDLVEFLNDKMVNEGGVVRGGQASSVPKSKGETVETPSSATKPLGMPSSTKVKIATAKKAALQKQQVQQTDGSTSGDDDDSLKTTAVVSPKDTLFDRVYERYPPILTENCTGVGEEDVRQKYHPLLQEFQISSSHDMDLVFVGTASCTPGVSRGVSCTALRLNWKRRSFHVPELSSTTTVPNSNNNGQQQQEQHENMVDMASSFSGGTWLFDCGECTQVGSFLCLFHFRFCNHLDLELPFVPLGEY